MMKSIEILAPCGSIESVYSAVRSGADAVYLGVKDFSARASADNFDYQQLQEAVDYCHIAGVKVYLTINTIVFDSELEKLKKVIVNSAKCSIDAVIVQSMGVATLVKNLVPTMPLHASTQMSVHSLSGAKLLEEMGFKRVVLSREMSKSEIKKIADNCNIELEVFVHGALCMCVSGQCYFSAMLGGRSGNRGRCAQPCRLPFAVDNKEGYALSLKDNSLVEYIRDLQDIGVTSAKIEGRMKRPEYVASAVNACVEARDCGAISEKNSTNLANVFARTGFTDGYYTAKRGYNMFGYRQKDDVISATSKLLSDIRQGYKDECQRVNIDLCFEASIGSHPQLTVVCGEDRVVQIGEVMCEKAQNRPLDLNRCKAQLAKTGGTPYRANNIQVYLENGVTMPISALNEMRRKAIEKLSNLRKSAVKHTITDYQIPTFTPHISQGKKLYTRTATAELGEGFKQADICFVPVLSNVNQVKNLLKNGYKVGVEIPRTMFSREEKVIQNLQKLKEIGIQKVLCNNLAGVYIAKNLGLEIYGGFGLNFANTLDLLWAEQMGFVSTEVSFELTIHQIENLGGTIDRGIISYGYLPLMVVRNCPNKSKNVSCKTCGGQGKMQDRLNKTFIFYCDGECAEVLNCAALDVLDYTQKSQKIDFEVFRFSVENSVEKVDNIPDFISKTLKNCQKTHGLYNRGVI